MWLLYLSKFKWVFILLGGLAAFYAIINHYENKGYNRAVVEIQTQANKEIVKATKNAIKNAETKIKAALKTQQALHDSELKRAKDERVITEVINNVETEIEKIVYVEGDCTDFGSDYIRLRNKAISAANLATRIDN